VSLIVRVVEARPHVFAYVVAVWGIIILVSLVSRVLEAL
jgi:hypothetical protein